MIGITWDPPASDGGSPIDGYIIEKTDTTSGSWTKAFKGTIQDTEFTVRDLKEGEEYQLRVAAVNKAGQGAYSEPSQHTVCESVYGKLKNP